VTSALVLLSFLSVAQQESGTRKAIFWSVTVYNKNLSSQYNLLAQTEPVEDKILLSHFKYKWHTRDLFFFSSNDIQKSEDLRLAFNHSRGVVLLYVKMSN